MFYENIAKKWESYNSVFFLDIHDFNDFVSFIVKHVSRIPWRVLFIDSVNSIYRLVAHRREAFTEFNLALALIAKETIGSDRRVFASAQVRAELDSEEITASGMSILNYWFDSVFQLGWENNYRFIKVIKPPLDLKLYFKITNRGVEWIDH